jgi:hypothetical protein
MLKPRVKGPPYRSSRTSASSCYAAASSVPSCSPLQSPSHYVHRNVCSDNHMITFDIDERFGLINRVALNRYKGRHVCVAFLVRVSQVIGQVESNETENSRFMILYPMRLNLSRFGCCARGLRETRVRLVCVMSSFHSCNPRIEVKRIDLAKLVMAINSTVVSFVQILSDGK